MRSLECAHYRMGLSDSVWRQTGFIEQILQDLARMNGRQPSLFCMGHVHCLLVSLVIIHDLHVVCISITPSETDSELPLAPREPERIGCASTDMK